jgi:hypothetical protein
MKTDNKAAWNPLLLALIVACSMLFFACSLTDKGDIVADAPEQFPGPQGEPGAEAKPFFALRDCTTDDQYGYSPWEKRAFAELDILIKAGEFSDGVLFSDYSDIVEMDVNEDYGDRHYVAHCTATIQGKYYWDEGGFRGTFEYREVGSWARPEIDSDRKCEYTEQFSGTYDTGKVAESTAAPAPGTKIRFTPTGKTTTDELYTWDGGKRSNDDHFEQDYAYVLDFTVAKP